MTTTSGEGIRGRDSFVSPLDWFLSSEREAVTLHSQFFPADSQVLQRMLAMRAEYPLSEEALRQDQPLFAQLNARLSRIVFEAVGGYWGWEIHMGAYDRVITHWDSAMKQRIHPDDYL